MAYSVQIFADDFVGFKKFATFLWLPEVKPIIGRSAQNMLRDWLYQRDRMFPNKLGGDRTHFYGQAARGTTYLISPEAVVISVNQVGIRLRWEGGVVTAGQNTSWVTGQPTKYLTIPAIAEAYGHRAKDFANLTTAYGRGGRPVALVEAAATLLKARRVGISAGKQAKERKGALVGGRVYYWLVPSTMHKPDPSVMPSNAQLVEHIEQDVLTFLSRKGGYST